MKQKDPDNSTDWAIIHIETGAIKATGTFAECDAKFGSIYSQQYFFIDKLPQNGNIKENNTDKNY